MFCLFAFTVASVCSLWTSSTFWNGLHLAADSHIYHLSYLCILFLKHFVLQLSSRICFRLTHCDRQHFHLSSFVVCSPGERFHCVSHNCQVNSLGLDTVHWHRIWIVMVFIPQKEYVWAKPQEILPYHVHCCFYKSHNCWRNRHF